MNSRAFNSQFEKVTLLGSDAYTNKKELKKIKLFNVFCLAWYGLMFLALLEDLIKNHTLTYEAAITTLSMGISMGIIQYIHFKKNYMIANVSYVLAILILTFYFSNYLSIKQLLEYYYIFAPLISLVFIDIMAINISVLVLSYSLFLIPNIYFKHYPLDLFSDISIAFLFAGVFILVNYFKTLNSKNEATLESKKEELEQINKYQSQFFINISHEIRTPLTLIKGRIEELKKINCSHPQLRKIEQGLSHQVNDIKSMVDDVLDSAKIKSADFKLNFEQISISKLVNQVYISFDTNFKLKNIDFKLINLDTDYWIKASPEYLKRALNNILINALKYTDKGGKVSMELISYEQELILSVVDNGIGISKDDLCRICNEFYQVDNDINRSGGSGIGLTFSKKIIELHEGKLQILSKCNEGSEFKLVFPIKDCNVITKGDYAFIKKDKIRDDNKNILKPKNKERLLIVDDNNEMRKYLKMILKNYKCLEAENGIEALSVLDNNPVDFIITDYMMPKMDGPDFLALLKEKQYFIPVLMLTARTDKESRLQSFRLGIDDYLNKPFDQDELLIRVQNALNNHKNRIAYINETQIGTKEVEESLEWIEQVEEYIYEKCSSPKLKQLDIAEHFNVSESSLYRKIKSSRGVTPNEFITEVKLQKARELIENDPEISLKRLSLEVGFQHNYYFSQIFYERFGHKPLEKFGLENV